MRNASRHPPSSVLADLAEGRPPPDGAEDFRTHIAGCARCTAEVESLRRLVEVMRSDREDDAPPALLAGAVRLFQDRAQPARPGPIARLLAILQSDSQQHPVALGTRAAGSDGRQLLFQAEGHTIDLRISPRGGAWAVSGQLLGPDAHGEVELAGSTESARGEINEFGEFALPDVPAGRYRLLLRLGPLEIETPELEIGG